MTRKLLILTVLLTLGFAQETVLGNAAFGNCVFGVSGTAPPPPPSDSIGACWWNSTEPLHGGKGYSDIVDYTALSNNHVSSWIVTGNGTPADSLASFLNESSTGDTIYIIDSLEIDLSGQTEDNIPGGTILCSGRGATLSDTTSWGALLYISDDLSSNYDDLFVSGGSNARLTGLRLRGKVSYLEGNMVTTDSFTLPAYNGGDAFRANHDSCTIDNCEIWGFAYAPFRGRYEADSFKVHHNYIHHGNHAYHGYGMLMLDSCSYKFESNYTDYFGWIIMGGGGNYGRKVDGIIRYNYIGEHSHGAAIYEHADQVDSAETINLYGNTIMRRGGRSHNLVTAYAQHYPSRDSLLIYRNWFWETDSQTAIQYTTSLCRITDNDFGTTASEDNVTKLPVAAIWSNTDSGAVALVCSLSALNSTDPDGSVTTAYWQLGDSAGTSNWLRTGNPPDTFVHTFSEIGNYYVELRVHDNNGIPDWDYKTIKVTPTSNDSHFLSCWVKDRVYSNQTGQMSKEIWLDNWKAWDSDVAGNGSWEHVIIDVTDTLDTKDSITITFKFKCDGNVSLWEPRMYVDDVVLYGANVVNGNFESGPWTGTNLRTDGHWSCAAKSGMACWDWYMDTNSGLRCIELQGGTSAGDSAIYYQRVDVY